MPHDDRGRPVPRVVTARRASAMPETNRRIEARLAVSGSAFGATEGLILIGVVVGLGTLLSAASVLPLGGARGLAYIALLALGLWLIRALPPRVHGRYGFEELRDAVLAEGLCPCCGYSLLELAGKPEPDGCTVCPECGAAWRMA